MLGITTWDARGGDDGDDDVVIDDGDDDDALGGGYKAKSPGRSVHATDTGETFFLSDRCLVSKILDISCFDEVLICKIVELILNIS